ncbi:MAG: hypothetical protein AAFW70_17130 [Cyanobacteria bacterium J06635_10]
MIEGFFGMILGLVFIGFSAVAVGAEELQTEITEEDLQIINKLVKIAQKNSYQVREAKYEMGFHAFVDIVSIELSPSQSRTNYKTPDFSSEDERSFSISLTIDPVQIFTAIDKMPVMKARLRETKQQTRLKVMKQYLAYLQARQASKITAYQMHKFEKRERIAIASNAAVGNSRQLDNVDYVAVATDVFNKNIQERLALEELADVVGLSPEKMINILDRLD